MNEELENQLANIIEKSMKIAEQTGEFVIEQAPELLQEFYLWHTWRFILTISICFIFLISVYGVYIFLKRKVKQDDSYLEWDDIGPLIFTVAAPIVSVFCIGIMIDAAYNLTFISVAPKLYLIEYFLK